MAFKFFVFCAVLAVVRAGAILESALPYAAGPALAYGAPAYTSQSQNILRSEGNLAQISTYSKTIDTPYSSESKSDVRVSNPGIYQSIQYASPAYSYAAPAPVLAKTALAAPISYAAPQQLITKQAIAAPLAYAAPQPLIAKPALAYGAPAYAQAAPLAYGAPAYAHAAPLAYAGPQQLIAKQAIAAPLAYAAPQPLIAKPALAYGAPAYAQAAPLAYAAPQPLIAKPALAYGAPALAAHAAPALAYNAPGAIYAHTTFTGLGTSYAF